MARHAVCYIVTDSYLFPTVVSAMQAREQLSRDAEVIVAAMGPVGVETPERAAFARVCAAIGVHFLPVDDAVLGGLGPMYGRLLLDRILPPEIEEILYLDGDTQVTGSLDDLMFAEPPTNGAIAVRDPMVFIRSAGANFRAAIDEDWDASRIPAPIRERYLNAGMLRLSRTTLGDLRERALALQAERGATLRFGDQDLINLSLEDRVDIVSIDWDFPGFMIDSPLYESSAPRMVHFMSNPRPWNAPLWPWGRRYFDPYADFVARFPETEPFWSRFRGRHRLRYQAQQAYKRLLERPTWRSPRIAASIAELRSTERPLAPRGTE